MGNQGEIPLPLTDKTVLDAVWSDYTDMSYNSYYQARTFLLVHHPGAKYQNRLFKNVTGSHAMENFMEVYRNQYSERYRTNNRREKLDMYLTFAPCGAPHSREDLERNNCATKLRAFAEDYNFELNIKVAAPWLDDKELCYLMTSQYCTVEAFTERENYRVLAGYLGLTLKNEWDYREGIIERDEKTRKALKKIKHVSAWKVFTEPNIPSPQTYLFVHNPSDKNQTMLWTSDKNSHAEKKFIEAFREDKEKTEREPIKLDMYIAFAPCGAQEMNCAWELRAFAEEYNLYLNIKVAAPYNQNDKELCYLMTSQYCTVEAFKNDDYIDLRRYLGLQRLDDWKQTQDIMDRDGETRRKLEEIRHKSAWKVFTDTRILSPRTYLLVHNPSVRKQNTLFTYTEELHGGEKVVNAYKNEETPALDMYINFADADAQGKKIHTQLIKLAEGYKGRLNIKVAASYYQNENALQDLTGIDNCTVEAFKKEDYIDLAGYLGFPIIPETTISRDKETDQALRLNT